VVHLGVPRDADGAAKQRDQNRALLRWSMRLLPILTCSPIPDDMKTNQAKSETARLIARKRVAHRNQDPPDKEEQAKMCPCSFEEKTMKTPFVLSHVASSLLALACTPPLMVLGGFAWRNDAPLLQWQQG
jgi:hypothetical protein